MMKKASIIRFAVFALIAAGLMLGAASVCSAQTDASAPSSADLAKRIDDLEKELAALKSEMASRPAPAAAPAAAAMTTPAPAAPKGLSGLLAPTTLSGLVDVYYDYNSNQPIERSTALRNFDINSAQFGLNLIELVADKPVAPDANHVGYHLALGFGQAINLMNAGEMGSPLGPGTPLGGPVVSNFDQYLKEGYLEYLAPVGKGLQVNVGKFVTPVGGEVIESKDNWNYTRGILFAWAIPYFHFGMSAKYAFNDKFALTGYLLNGWNNSVDNNSGKTTGVTLAWTPNDKFSFIENYLVGPEQTNDNSDFRHIADTVVSYSPTSKLSFMANFDYGHDRVPGLLVPGVSSPVWWTGIAGYIKYAPNDKWYIATRGEWFNDHNGFSTGTAQKLSEFTLTLNRSLASNLTSRLEYRRDMSDHNVFPYHDSDIMGSLNLPRGAQNTVSIGLIYAFSTEDTK